MKLGYRNVKVFAAGYPEWKKFAGEGAKMAALPKAEQKAAAKSIKAGKEEGSIDIETFKKILKDNPGSIMLVDVRDPDEYASGSFKTAVNIPTNQLEKKIQSLPSDKPIVFVCNTGARSGEAYYMVKDLRPSLKDVYYLEAECTYKKGGEAEIKASK